MIQLVINMNKETTCCFTGHRPHKVPLLGDRADPRCKELENTLSLEILAKALVFHCDTFLCGMAQGTDMLCGDLVLRLRHIYKLPLRLICVIPCLSQAQDWDAGAQAHYKWLLSQADGSVLLQRGYTDGCYLRRNEWMVAHSAHMVALLDPHIYGGTAYTVSLARKSGLNVSVVRPPV